MNQRKEKRRKSRAVFTNPHEDRRRRGYDVRGRLPAKSAEPAVLGGGEKKQFPESGAE